MEGNWAKRTKGEGEKEGEDEGGKKVDKMTPKGGQNGTKVDILTPEMDFLAGFGYVARRLQYSG